VRVFALRRVRGIINFFRETWEELKKVSWPTRREAGYLTALVILLCVIVAVLLGLFDYGFSKLVDLFLVR